MEETFETRARFAFSALALSLSLLSPFKEKEPQNVRLVSASFYLSCWVKMFWKWERDTRERRCDASSLLRLRGTALLWCPFHHQFWQNLTPKSALLSFRLLPVWSRRKHRSCALTYMRDQPLPAVPSLSFSASSNVHHRALHLFKMR